MEDYKEVAMKLHQSIMKIIEVDVKRSFNIDPNYPKKDLIEILWVSSYLIEDGMGYCQG